MNDLEDFINKTIKEQSLEKINDHLYLKTYQKEVLDYYHIPYQNCSSIPEILFLIDEVLASELDESSMLEEVASSLQEMQYYYNSPK